MFYYPDKELFYNSIIREELLCKYAKLDAKRKAIELSHVTLHTSSKKCITDTRYVLNLLLLLDTIAGQKPKITKTKVSHAEFKIKPGMPIGATVTLRKHRALTVLFTVVTLLLPKQSTLFPVSCNSTSPTITLGVQNGMALPALEAFSNHYTNGMQINLHLKDSAALKDKLSLMSSFLL